MRQSKVKTLGAIALACASTGSFGQALDPIPFPAGIGCSFPLTIQPLAADPRTVHVTGTGTVVTAGPFGDVQLINANTGKSVSLSSKGAPWRSVENRDGTFTNTFTGHWVIVWFPSDQPAGIGPATIEYVGRLVVRQDGDVSTLVSQQGREVRDICAALS